VRKIPHALLSDVYVGVGGMNKLNGSYPVPFSSSTKPCRLWIHHSFPYASNCLVNTFVLSDLHISAVGHSLESIQDGFSGNFGVRRDQSSVLLEILDKVSLSLCCW
jgi:hypothetical protein